MFKSYIFIYVYMFIYIYIYIYIYICNFMYMFYLLSSPYLRVFDDDRVHGTWEQMLLMQVAQVKLSRGEGFNLGNSYVFFIAFRNSCKP